MAKNEEKPKHNRCAVYTRVSTTEGLDQDFTSLDNQREAAQAYIASQKNQGWIVLPTQYEDGGFSGGNMNRPGLERLFSDIGAGLIDTVVVYKLDRISRSFFDFAKIWEFFEEHKVSFVIVTQLFDTTTAAGRCMLMNLLSFAQYEREMIAERTLDKMSAARRKGKWVGGIPLLGYDIDPKGGKLHVNEMEAAQVREIFNLYLETGSLLRIVQILNERGWTTKRWLNKKGMVRGGDAFDKGRLLRMLSNKIYLGKVAYRGCVYEGEHDAIVAEEVWQDVQEQRLKSNSVVESGIAHKKRSSLLEGLLFCGVSGSAMNYSCTRKGSRLYGYYVCFKREKQECGCQIKRFPAAKIEQVVLDEIGGIGQDPAFISETLTQQRAITVQDIVQASSRFGAEWKCLGMTEKSKLLNILLERIQINQDKTISMKFCPSGIKALSKQG